MHALRCCLLQCDVLVDHVNEILVVGMRDRGSLVVSYTDFGFGHDHSSALRRRSCGSLEVLLMVGGDDGGVDRARLVLDDVLLSSGQVRLRALSSVLRLDAVIQCGEALDLHLREAKVDELRCELQRGGSFCASLH